MDRNEESPLQKSSSSEDIESWTIVDRSPEVHRPKMKPGETIKTGAQPEKEEESEDEENDEEESEEEGSGSEEADEEDGEEEEVRVEKSSKPSGIEPVKSKPKQTKSENVARDEDADGRVVEQGSIKKKRTGSNASSLSHDGCSSDGISVISESDGSEHARLLHFNKQIHFDPLQQPSTQLTPPISPEREDGRSETERSKRHKQLKRKRSHDDTTDDTALVPENSVVPWRHVNRTSFMVFSILMTGVAAILVGNSRVYENRANVDNFNHEQRLSELELENTILKNEMNKLKHLYTQSELDEQVQQAEFEWMQAMDQEMQDQSPLEPEPQPEPEPPMATTEPKPEQPPMRRVPPQDENIRHKVVWSGDDGQPMLIADKDYVLPEFCYNKNAVKDELFSEYSTKYCDTKQLKIEAKLKKAEYYASKHNKHKHPRDYKQYIHPTAEEVADQQKQSTASPPKAPSLSPFEFDYMRAFETIKEEGSVILQSLTAILDLDPEPELIPNQNDGYLADDEASSSSSSSSIGSVQPEIAPPVDAINWTDYPSWVREKYENQPEMYRKLQNKASLLWEWERKKNQFLDEVGLTTLEEVDRRTEDELRQRRQQYAQEREGKSEHKKSEKYDDRKGKGGKYEDRKEWKQERPRNGDNRSYENKDHHQKDHPKEWKDKKDWPNGDKKREYHSKEGASSASNEASQRKQYSDDNRESSGEQFKDHRKHGEHSKERRDGERKDHHQKHRENDSDERSSSGDGNYMKQYHQEEYKKQYKAKEDYHQERKGDGRKQHHERRRDSDHDDDDDDDDDDHYKHRKHRNGDYRKHEHKEWHDKRHKHRDEHWNKQHHHEEKKWHDRDRDHHQSKERRR